MAIDFREKEKIERLLWCDRHCCLCEKACRIDIEFAHIDPKGSNNIDNAIPVCYDCHAHIGMYNSRHPRGNKFRIKELKIQREQIYDKYTRHLIVPLPSIITNLSNPNLPNNGKRKYPDITFNITNKSDYLPTKLYITLRGILNDRSINLGLGDGLYTGTKVWNLNPGNGVNGHFEISNKRLRNLRPNDRLEIRAKIKQIDIWSREHNFLENGYVYAQHEDENKAYWYFEP